MIKVAPSILSADFRNIEKELKKVESSGGDLIHMDVMDGHFVPNITFGPMIVRDINRSTQLPLDVHLMIENPDFYLEAFVQAGADYLTVSFEACKHLHRTLSRIRELKVKVGCALNPATPFELVKPVMGKLDLLLLMTVNPGFGGQKLIPEVLPKIKEAKEFIMKNSLETEIEVDGGINPKTSKSVVESGATILVAGDAVFKSSNYKEAIRKLKENN
ncbi:MAG: ribulose-phosphate 3-epimerase [Candidatus Zixiibacteriota bacterium]